MLSFSKANSKLKKLQAKLGKKVYSFDILAGWTCPGAHDCMSKVHEDDAGRRTVKDGRHTKFRCYAASLEAVFPDTYNKHKRNTDVVRSSRSPNVIASKINAAMPADAGIIRGHSSGDLFNKVYFQAWILVAKRNPDKKFYFYTKNIPVWLDLQHTIPDNMIITASYGGKHDHLIGQHGLKSAEVVYSREEAAEKGIPIDEDDSYALDASVNRVGLLIHGIQPAKSAAAAALEKLKRQRD